MNRTCDVRPWPGAALIAVAALVSVTGCVPAERRRNSAALRPAAPAQSLRLAELPGGVDAEHRRNARPFIQDNLWTHGNEQYAVWVDDSGRPFVGKRALPSGAWSHFDLGSIPGNPLAAPTAPDGHNVYVIAVDRAGFIHIAGNMHNTPLRYIRSERPGDIRAWARKDMVGRDENSVTYPAFVRRRSGDLLFFYRDGYSGHGDLLLNAYRSGRWARVGEVIDGTATDESPYIHHVAVDRRDDLHLLFAWRRTGDAATTNDLSYARSADGGRSWQRTDGRRFGKPIVHGSAELVIDTPDRGSGLSNAGGLEIDGRGRPHGAVLLGHGGRRQLWHVWYDGGWEQRLIVDPEVRPSRAAVVTDTDRVFFLLSTRRDIRLVDVTPGTRNTTATLVSDQTVAGWEPTVDTQGLYRDGIVHVLVPTRADDRRIGLATASLELQDAA